MALKIARQTYYLNDKRESLPARFARPDNKLSGPPRKGNGTDPGTRVCDKLRMTKFKSEKFR
jgi:hypothetical protein